MTIARVPPHDLEAESTVLSACLLGQDLDEVAAVLRPEHLYSNANQDILRACYALHEAGQAVDCVSVSGWLRTAERLQQVGGTAYLAQVVDATPAVAHVEQHARRLVDLWRMRRLGEVCAMTSAESYSTREPVQRFIDAHEQTVFELGHQQTTAELRHVGEVARECYSAAEEARKRGSVVTGTPIGIRDLDQLTSGMHPGDVYVVAGRPGSGKSSFATSAALDVARGRLSVGYWSLEMPAQQIGQRMLAAEGLLALSAIRSGRLTDPGWSRLNSAVQSVGGLPIHIDDSVGLTIWDLRARARRLSVRAEKTGVPLGLIVVDHLGLMRGAGQSREQEVARISIGLKQLAKELHVPVMALHQLNRQCETRQDKRPQLSDLRDSGSVEQDADVVLMLYRDEYYNGDRSQERGMAEVIIAKQRNGPTGTVKVAFEAATVRFRDLAETPTIDQAAMASTDLDEQPEWYR